MQGAETSSEFFWFLWTQPAVWAWETWYSVVWASQSTCFSGCDTSPTVDCCSFSICRTQSPEELGRVGERSLGWTACRAATLTFFFYAYAEKERTRREGLRWLHSNCTHYSTMHAEERQRECSQRHSEVRAGRLSGRFRLRAYRTVRSRPVSSRSVQHGIFPYVYFYTQSLQRPHERRPMASRREQVSALFFVAWTQRRLTECFPWATEGPNPPKETLTFKKDFFWQTASGSLPAGLKGSVERSLLPGAIFLIFTQNRPWKSEDHLRTLFFIEMSKEKLEKSERTPPVSWRPWALAYSRDRPYNFSCLSAVSKNRRFHSFFSRLWVSFAEEKPFMTSNASF